MTMYLDYYEQMFEAAKGFDDDLDFCPSLSPSELREIQKTRGTISPSWRRHHHHHHHHHSQHGDKRRIPSSSLSYASYPYSSPSSSSASSGASSPSLSYTSLSASPPTSPAPNPTTSRAIAIVDPISRTPVQLPGATSAAGSGPTSSSGTVTTSSGNTPGDAATAVVGSSGSGRGGRGESGSFSGGSGDSCMLSLPPPLMLHESELATTPLDSSDSSILFSPSLTSTSSSSTFEDMFDGTLHHHHHHHQQQQQFWMEYPSVTAQYFPYPPPPPQDFTSFLAPTPGGSYPVHHYPAIGTGGGGPAGFVAVPMMMMGF